MLKRGLIVIILLGIVLLLSISAQAKHKDGHVVTLQEFVSNEATLTSFDQMSRTDQQQYLKDQIKAGVSLSGNPELRRMAQSYARSESFNPHVSGDDMAIAEEIYGSNDHTQNANSINNAPQGFVKYRRAKGNTKFEITGQIKSYDPSTSTLSTEHQSIKLDSFTEGIYGILINEKNEIVIIDKFGTPHSFKGSLGAFQEYPDVGKLLLLESGSIDGYKIEKGAFRISKLFIQGSFKSFNSIVFSRNEDLLFDTETQKTILPDDTYILAITDAKIAGTNIFLPNGDMILDGQITYKDGNVNQVDTWSSVIVQKVTHTTNANPLEIRFATNSKLEELISEEAAALNEADLVTFIKFGNRAQANAKLDKLNLILSEKRIEARSLRVKSNVLANLIRNGKATQEERTEYKGMRQRIIEVDVGIAQARKNFDTAAKIIVPSELRRNEIIYDYRQRRNQEYQQIISDIKPKGNYFIYGKGRLWTGGKHFSSSLTQDNQIFPEFVLEFKNHQTQRRRGLLSISPQGGEVDMQKLSLDTAPLAIGTQISGAVTIDNGKFEITSDGNDLLSKTIETDPNIADVRSLVASDMRIKYHAENEVKEYDLDVDASYSAPLEEEERININRELQSIKASKEANLQKLEALEKDPQTQIEIAAASKELATLRTSDAANAEKLNHWYGQLRRAVQIPDQNPVEQQRRLSRINSAIADYDAEQNEIWLRMEEIRENSALSWIETLQFEIERNTNDELRLSQQLRDNRGESKLGAFGQVLKPKGSGSGISYQEYIHGFPIRKNADIFLYEDERYDPNIGFTRGYTRLATPLITERNSDKLNLDVVQYQECIDTQFRLAYEYAVQTGQNICFSNGRICLNQYSNKRNFLNKWMSTQGTRVYEQQALKGLERGDHWTKDIQVIHPDSYGGVQPGDVILTGGHAIAVKEVLEIDGEKYIRKFAGSMPAIDAHIYKDLVKVSGLKTKAKQGKIMSIYRWKFRGESKPIEELDELYELSTQK
tara:strand:- start:57111 stop:60110 length:3000 start_codon:yes stop_codon:yes gene_type:complete